MAQLVRCPVAQCGALRDLVERAAEVARIQQRADRGSEDMAAVAPNARGRLELVLPLALELRRYAIEGSLSLSDGGSPSSTM